MYLKLTIAEGGGDPRSYGFEGPRIIVIGRGTGGDVVLFDHKVSRQHCTITLDAERAEVSDDGSVNGTYLNGTRVTKARLSTGDVLRVADTDLKVELGTKPCDTARATPVGPLEVHPLVQIPGYEVMRCLGGGEFGAVYKARSKAGEAVAIKVLRIEKSTTDADRKRFLREASMAEALVHPNIVRILDRGETGATLYLVMEFVHGETLSALVTRRGPPTSMVALQIMRQIASALEAARKKDIVHRDVKPENILIRDDGVAKLADFGFAKSVRTAGQSGLTHQGDVVGTLAYMAPEQLVSSIKADHRSDIYSFGATLFHVLTGTPPFNAKTNDEFFRKILRSPAPSIAEVRKDVPLVLDAIVARCLQKRPDERYKTAGELVELLDRLLTTSSDKTSA